ncbi:hypothetical protein HRI_004000200 [Hibiscus trionum]|uniref:Retrovirus-related Pol polyprotein from transposon TNT 1-94-like beta-barrel domain-containing protein n=1 Tax=Hibiscus trionum TaxID=183268 RepID=A0A9W7MKU3_HIBTR|nr:hypothetical protein HRI_004000200 [Hibiscus trionum]
METALFAKNKGSFIDGTLNMPNTTASDLQRWKKNDAMVQAWLRNSLANDIQESFVYTESAHEIWTELSEGYGQSNAPKLFKIKKDFSNLFQENGQSLTNYYTKFKTLWQELQICDPLPHCKCEAAKQHLLCQEREKAHQFLLGLNDSFERLKSNILSMEPTPSLSKIFSLALQEEQSLQKNEPPLISFEGAVLVAKADHKQIENDRTSHNQRSYRNNKRCQHCDKSGHLKEECFELIRYPVNWRNNQQNRGVNDRRNKNNFRQKQRYGNIATTDCQSSDSNENPHGQIQQALGLTTEQCAKLMQIIGDTSGNAINFGGEVMTNFAGKNSLFHKTWIVDSGASDHMVGNKSILDNVKHVSSFPDVKIPNDSSLSVSHIGDINLKSNMTLKNVICVPGHVYQDADWSV